MICSIKGRSISLQFEDVGSLNTGKMVTVCILYEKPCVLYHSNRYCCELHTKGCYFNLSMSLCCCISGQSYMKRKKKTSNSYDEMLSAVRSALKQKFRKYNVIYFVYKSML